MIGHFCAAKLGPNKVLVHREFADVKNTYLFDIITKKFTEIDKPVQIKSYGKNNCFIFATNSCVDLP